MIGMIVKKVKPWKGKVKKIQIKIDERQKKRNTRNKEGQTLGNSK
jgi:hypothetical protein